MCYLLNKNATFLNSVLLEGLWSLILSGRTHRDAMWRPTRFLWERKSSTKVHGSRRTWRPRHRWSFQVGRCLIGNKSATTITICLNPKRFRLYLNLNPLHSFTLMPGLNFIAIGHHIYCTASYCSSYWGWLVWLLTFCHKLLIIIIMNWIYLRFSRFVVNYWCRQDKVGGTLWGFFAL